MALVEQLAKLEHLFSIIGKLMELLTIIYDFRSSNLVEHASRIGNYLTKRVLIRIQMI